jgi:hypothetical protein
MLVAEVTQQEYILGSLRTPSAGNTVFQGARGLAGSRRMGETGVVRRGAE